MKLFKKKVNGGRTDKTPPASLCDHLEIDGTYRKEEIRVLRTNQANHVKIRLASPCPLCKVVYASWKSHGQQHFLKTRHTQHLDSPPRGYLIPAVSRDGPPLALNFGNKSPPASPCDVLLVYNQLGEAHHALVCGLILKDNLQLQLKAMLIWEAQPDVKMDPIEKLFDWYKIGLTSETKYNKTKKLGAEETTRIIGAAFRACQTQTTPGSNTIGQLYISQEEFHERIRKALSQASHASETSDLGYNLHGQYFRPSYASKYWLNRYFALTVRMRVENVEWNKRLPAKLFWKDILRRLQGKKAISLPNWLKLPKKDEIKRLAVIHVRCTPPSDQAIGRSMDKPNLQHVARTIANVDCTVEARRKNPQQWQTGYTCLEPFSHVLLYGDFNYDKAESMRSDMGKALEKCKLKISVGFASRPWQNNNQKETDERVGPFLKKFNDSKFDHLPVQVKALAIWVALYERYSPDICVIGHRTGFVEAAAFIGIPVFYLNNEREKMTGQPDRLGELLWMPPMGTAAEDRLREVSDVMNTLIRIESPARERKKDKKTNLKLPFHIDPKYEHELAAALFMFMCCVPTGNQQQAQAVTPGGRPAWMNRVNIMHRAPGGGGTGPDRELLKSIYNYVQGEFRSHLT